jgi:hypothetical protein
MKIEDGKGKNGDVGVSKNQRLDVSARSNNRIFYASRDDGLAYRAVYAGMTLAAGDICAYLKNTSSTRFLFVNHIELNAVQAVTWKVFQVTGTAADGELITPSELNLSKAIPAEAIAMAGDTTISALSFTTLLGVYRTGAGSGSEFEFHDALILGPGDAIAVEYDAGTGGLADVNIECHFEDFDA